MRRTRHELDGLVAAACGGWVRDEHHRAPPGWSDRLRLLRDYAAGRAVPADGESLEGLRCRVERTAIGVLAQRRRWRTADRMVRALREAESPRWERTRVQSVDGDGQLVDGSRLGLASVEWRGVTVPLHGRPLPDHRRAHPAATAARLAGCRRRWLIHARRSGAACEVPLCCDDPLCPDCMDTRAGQRRDRDTGAIVHLAHARCPVLFMTLTLRNDRRRARDLGPVVLTDEDLEHWPDLVEHHRRATAGDRVAYTTGGESLSSRVRAVETCWRRLIDSRRHRPWWDRHVLGYRLGIETTARATDRRGQPYGRLGWHVHLHLVLVLRPSGVDPRDVADELCERWASIASDLGECAERAAQDVQVIADGSGALDEAALSRAVAQALKYPGKVADMPAGCIWEFAAALRGRTLHRPGGLLHSATRAGALARAVAVCELAREGRRAEDEQGRPLSPDDALAACRRWGITDESGARQALAAEVGPPLVGRAILAWRSIVAVDDVGEDGDPDPIAGVLVRLHEGRAYVVTRARLRMWARAGAVLHLALAPPGTIDDGAARRAELVPHGRRLASDVLAGLSARPPPAA